MHCAPPGGPLTQLCLCGNMGRLISREKVALCHSDIHWPAEGTAWMWLHSFLFKRQPAPSSAACEGTSWDYSKLAG